jgi:hypothetical protein
MTSDGMFLMRDRELVEMRYAPYEAEADLQVLLEHHPALLPGRQIDPASPRGSGS